MSEISNVGGRNKYVEISSEETLPPGELWKAEPKPIETRSSEMVIYGQTQHDTAVKDAASFAGVKVKDVTAPVTPPSIFVRG